jgi:prepilin-type processing-associated H-X9-DG protein
MIPAVQKVREAAARSTGQNNLKQIALAMHNSLDANDTFPAHAIYSKDGQRPLLSWRVAILPYIEQDALYRQFKLDEPWDSEHNKKLIPLMPRIYASPGAPPTPQPGLTHYRVFVGLGAGFELRPRGIGIRDITDGTSNTIMAVESNDPVIWTKPDDAVFDPGQPLPKMTPIYPGGLNVAMFDGSVRMLSPQLEEKMWRALITRVGGEAINMGNLDRQPAPPPLIPAVQQVREPDARTAGQNNLKQIGLAMHNYHAANGAFPPHAIYSKDGQRPLLSWRVAILPYVEQDALYRQFKLDEPWDSEHNKKLFPLMPRIYASPGAPPAREPGLTHYRVFLGLGAGFELRARGTRIADIADGSSNTLLAIESDDPVVWTKPDDAAYDPGQPLPKMTPIHANGLNVAFFDGSVRMLSPKLDEKTWRALITRAGGEVFNLGNLDK